MEIILLEPINAHKIGEIIKVKAGYARNFLIPTGRAVRATENNREKFEREKVQYIAKLNDKLEILKMLYEIINGQEFSMKAKASSNMRLFGSINISQIFGMIHQYITEKLEAQSSTLELRHFLNKSLLVGNTIIKALGTHEIGIRFSSDLIANVKFKIENEGMVEEEVVVKTAETIADDVQDVEIEAVEMLAEEATIQ
jgi:large subunit ribosomal protein L9